MDREDWHDADHGVAKSQTRLSNWTEECSSTAMSFKNVFLVPMWKIQEKVKEMEQRWLSTAVNQKTKVWGERPFNIVTILTDKMGGMWWIFEN